MNKFIVFFLVCSSLYASTLPEPYSSIKILPEYNWGYYGNAKQIEAIFNENHIQIAVEVGSWLGGGSTKHIAELLRKKNGKLYSVDTWLGSTTQQIGEVHYQPELAYAYQQFLSNMIHWNLTNIVIPCRMKSIEAAKALTIRPDLVYIDAEHTEEAVYEDLIAWYPFVQGYGILCGDDWSWSTVRSAIEKFAAKNHLTIAVSDNFWLLHQ